MHVTWRREEKSTELQECLSPMLSDTALAVMMSRGDLLQRPYD